MDLESNKSIFWFKILYIKICLKKSTSNTIIKSLVVFSYADWFKYSFIFANFSLQFSSSNIMSNGDYYIGGYCNGAMQGQAEYHWANGRVYIGQYFDGHIHGKGTMINPDGTKKTGEWKKEKFVGKTSVTN